MNYVNRNPGVNKSIAIASREVSPRKSRSWGVSYRAVAPLAMAFDTLIIVSAAILSNVLYHRIIGAPGHPVQFGGFGAVVAVLFVAIAESRDLYNLSELLNLKSNIWRIAIKWIGIFLFLMAVAFTMRMGEAFSRGATLSFAAFGLAGLIGTRVLWRIFLADGLAVRRFSGRRVVFISERSSPSDLLEVLTRHGLQPAHHFILPTDPQRRKDIIAQAISAVRGSRIEEIVVGANLDHWSGLSDLFLELRVLPIPVNLIPVGPGSELFKLSSHTIGDSVTIELQHGPRTLTELAVKRALDVIAVGIGLVVLLPLLVLVAIAIKLDSPGPVIFRQRRCGFNGRKFRIFKFRTMSVMEDGETIIPAQLNDARVTRVGYWLRRTSIDELPQLFNVFRGDMSIVGPRPHAVAHDTRFEKLVGNYAFRHHVKPGLTGWAQVHGYRGEMRSVPDIEERIKLDLWYIDNWNLLIDFKITFMTIAELMRGEHAY